MEQTFISNLATFLKEPEFLADLKQLEDRHPIEIKILDDTLLVHYNHKSGYTTLAFTASGNFGHIPSSPFVTGSVSIFCINAIIDRIALYNFMHEKNPSNC